jgi:hypothetical protein
MMILKTGIAGAFLALGLSTLVSTNGQAAAVPVDALQAARSAASMIEQAQVVVRRRGVVVAPRYVAPRRVIVAPRRVVVGPGAVIVRPVRPWSRRPHYGLLIGGVALGTIIAVSAAGAVPTPPAADMCWYWADPTRTRGYWDYC